MIIIAIKKSDSKAEVTVAESVEAFRDYAGNNPDDYSWIGGVNTESGLHQHAIETLIAAANDIGNAEVYASLFDQAVKIGMEIQKREQEKRNKQDKIDRVYAMLFRAGFQQGCMDCNAFIDDENHLGLDRAQALIKGLESIGLNPGHVQEEVRKTAPGMADAPRSFRLEAGKSFGTCIRSVPFAEFLATLLP